MFDNCTQFRMRISSAVGGGSLILFRSAPLGGEQVF